MMTPTATANSSVKAVVSGGTVTTGAIPDDCGQVWFMLFFTEYQCLAVYAHSQYATIELLSYTLCKYI